MGRGALLPKHITTVVRHQKDPLRALDMFNSASKEDRFKHNLVTYKCMAEKLGIHGEFDSMENLISEMRMNVDNSLLEGVYIGAMRNYGRRGKLQHAVDTFERMDFYGCEPSVMSYNAIMNILVEYGYFDQSHKVYLRMLDKGIIPDVYTFTIRIKSFCRTRRPYVALRLLRSMPERGYDVNAITYCTVASGLYEENYHLDASNLFDEMLGVKICPDTVTFNKLIHVLCRKGDILETGKLLTKVLKRGVSLNLYSHNILIQGLCKGSKLMEAVSLLEKMGDGLTPDVITYNTLICGLCKNSKVVEADKYLHEMVNKGCAPDDFTYNTIIDGYCKLGLVQNACKVLKDAVFKGFVPDRVTYCSLINGLCEEGDIDRAIEIFNEALGHGLEPDVVIYNSLVKGLSKQGLVLQALDLLNEMVGNGCNPDIWTYNTIINGLCKMGNVSDAYNVMNNAMTKGFVPDVFTFNTLIDGYCKRLKLHKALEIVDRMWTHGVTPDAITYNSVLNGLCKAGNTGEVMETFKEMVSKGAHANVITYNILIESLCKSRQVKEASELFMKMVDEGLCPDTVSFSTLIHGFCRNNDLDGAYALFRKSEKDNFLATVNTYNIMISAYAEKLNVPMAEKLFLEMIDKGCPPDAFTYRVMLNGHCKTGNVDRAYEFLINMMNEGFIPSMATFGRVINCLCVKHRVQEAVSIVHIMVANASFYIYHWCSTCSCSFHSWRISSAFCSRVCSGVFICSDTESSDSSHHYTCTLEFRGDHTVNYSSAPGICHKGAVAGILNEALCQKLWPFAGDLFRYDWKEPFNLRKGSILRAGIGLVGAIIAVALLGAGLANGEQPQREVASASFYIYHWCSICSCSFHSWRISSAFCSRVCSGVFICSDKIF